METKFDLKVAGNLWVFFAVSRGVPSGVERQG